MMAAAVVLLFAQAGDSDVSKATSNGPVCDSPLDHPEVTLCTADEDDSDECDDPQTQLAMNTCALADYQAANAELNRQWDDTVAAMKARDAEREPGDGQPGYYETLLEAQLAWLTYRDAECRSESFMARGGSMQPMLEAQCRTYLTELRTEQLRVLAAGPEGD